MMNKSISLTLQEILIGILIAATIPSAAFIINNAITTARIEANQVMLRHDVDKKVDNDVLAQYIKFVRAESEKQAEINASTKEHITELEQQLKAVKERLHEFEVKYIGYLHTRGDSEQWDLEAITLFYLENWEIIECKQPKKVGLI